MGNDDQEEPLERLALAMATTNTKENHQQMIDKFQVQEDLFGIALQATNAAIETVD